jgi:hypothetical protein
MGRLADNSFFTHLATGRLILLDGSVPTTDPYTFSARGEPWVVQSWIASVLYAAAERLGGADAIRVLMGLVTVALVAGIWLLAKRADGVVARFGIAAVAVAVGATAWSPRPLMFGLLCLAMTLVVIEQRWSPWLLVPVLWFWVNTHGSFPLGLLAIVVLAVGRCLDRESPRVEMRGLCWALVGTALAVVNPLGPTLLTFPLRLLDRQDQFSYIIEWQSPDFSGTLGRVFLLQVLCALLLLARRPCWRSALVLVVFVALAMTASRNVAVASIVLVPGMAFSAHGLGSLRGDRRSPVFGLVALAGVVLGALIAVTALREPAFDLRRYPIDALAYAQQQGLLGRDARILANDSNGNYLELLRGPGAGTFADDRVDMLPVGVIDDLKAMIDAGPSAAAAVERWDPTVIVWSTSSPLADDLRGNPAWTVVYGDEAWMVLVPSGRT